MYLLDELVQVRACIATVRNCCMIRGHTINWLSIHGSILSYVCDQKKEIRLFTFVPQKLILEHHLKPQLNLQPLLQYQEVNMRFRLML